MLLAPDMPSVKRGKEPAGERTAPASAIQPTFISCSSSLLRSSLSPQLLTPTCPLSLCNVRLSRNPSTFWPTFVQVGYGPFPRYLFLPLHLSYLQTNASSPPPSCSYHASLHPIRYRNASLRPGECNNFYPTCLPGSGLAGKCRALAQGWLHYWGNKTNSACRPKALLGGPVPSHVCSRSLRALHDDRTLLSRVPSATDNLQRSKALSVNRSRISRYLLGLQSARRSSAACVPCSAHPWPSR